MPPTLNYEATLWQAGYSRVAGLDEVGRGALCASVVAAAVILTPDVTGLEEARDSKQLSPARRVYLAALIRQKALAIGLGAASPAEITRLNIRGATALAMQRALTHLPGWDYLLVDGRPMPELGRERQLAIVKGDSLSLSIACASIVAKVCRDHLLARLAVRYPGYGWEYNAGYPTPEHKAALRKLGVTRHHRVTYAPVRLLLNLEPIPELKLTSDINLGNIASNSFLQELNTETVDDSQNNPATGRCA